MSIFDRITLILLSIATIRKIIADNFNFLKGTKWSWILYDKKEVPYCYQLSKIKNQEIRIKYSSDLLVNIIIILGNHTKYFINKVYCDRQKTIQVHYMVNTLEASHNKQELQIMTDMAKLFYNEKIQSNPDNPIDFIISIKGGNVLLVSNLINSLGNEIIHLTFNRNLFYESMGVVESNDHDRKVGKDIKFENINELIRLSEANKNLRKLNGMIIDCSYSSGDGILQCVKNFKEIVDNENLNINTNLSVRTIYSHVNKDITMELDTLGCDMECVISLTDDIREKLYQKIRNEKDDNKKLSKAKFILNQLKKQNLINNKYINLL